MTLTGARLVPLLEERARALGFDAFGIAPAEARPDLPEKLAHALGEGWHADMDWMAETAERRSAPRALWPEARSVVMLGMNYGPEADPMERLADKTLANVSAYAQSRDYHEVIKGKLKDFAGFLARRGAAEVKVFVDTAPLMEKPFAQAAGLGWQGKHSVLVSREHGSWLFLGAVLTTLELPASAPHRESCGSCRRCLDVCPTDAFPAPFRLDARKCLAYWSVEARGQIPKPLRKPMGNRVFGCDDCLAVCPWNKFAQRAREAKLEARREVATARLTDMLGLDDSAFRAVFAGTPVKRLGSARFLRNCLVAAGNSDDPGHLPRIEPHLFHQNPLVRGMAVWALRRLADPDRLAFCRRRHLGAETDAAAAGEWQGEAA